MTLNETCWLLSSSRQQKSSEITFCAIFNSKLSKSFFRFSKQCSESFIRFAISYFYFPDQLAEAIMEKRVGNAKWFIIHEHSILCWVLLLRMIKIPGHHDRKFVECLPFTLTKRKFFGNCQVGWKSLRYPFFVIYNIPIDF